MADVRALLKAKRQEARIKHPLAIYNQSGQLKCSACGTAVKHASAWEGHLGSKIHRTNVARLKEQERAKEEQRLREEREEQEKILRGKRKAEDEEQEEQEEQQRQQQDIKKPKLDQSNAFPADFFSDHSRSLPILDHASDDEEQPAAAPTAAPATPLDLEWERFQREVVNAPDFKETYENATTFAEPVLNTASVQEGFPASGSSEPAQEPAQMNDEEVRQQKELDERELIMDRLLEEERAQEEADMKVVAMKNKLELIRRKRETTKNAKASTV